ncbi:phenylacetate--CoA ligase family protein [Desulfonatronovibrio hydrogenovorans]|uniref:phenylacetate--CoA ligase family protein n=1 Tax=Desulfonatronovibrio hydrogenovorans TaxID=53245 RepID=UPI00054F5102|nr:AMP-binding protein [Desulfonatronovibrio hydrogenovorans]
MSESGNRKKGFFHEVETMDPDQRRAYLWDKARHILNVAGDKSGAFRQRMEKAGLEPGQIKSLDDWHLIPALPKKDLVHLQTAGPDLGGLLTCPTGRLRHIYMSPGPIVDPEARQRDYWGFAEAFYAAGFRKSDIVQMTFSYHFTPAGLMMEEPLHEIGCAVFPAGPGNTEGQIEAMTRLGVTGYVGMASFLKIIADRAEKKGLDLRKDFRLDVAFVAAERLAESLRTELEDRFSMQIRQGYGTADLGCIAYECPEKKGMHLSSRCYVEICDPETKKPLPAGQTGEVVVTPFNPDYPLIRLATGDLSAFSTQQCPCGRTAPLLQGILGRVDDIIKIKGQFVYPAQVAEAMAGFPGIRAWKLVATNPGGRDRLSLNILASREMDTIPVSRAFQDKIKLRAEIVISDNKADFSDAGSGIEDLRTW